MSKHWGDTEGGRQRLIDVLERSGVPLETRVLQEVRTFCERYKTAGLASMHLGPLLWRTDADEPDNAYREIDACALFRQRFDFGAIQLFVQAYVPIEVKHRKGIEWFGFLTPHAARFPVASNAAYSENVADLYVKNADNLGLYRLAGISTEKGVKEKAFEEQLTQNACGALSNFIQHVAKGSIYRDPRPDFSQMPALLQEFSDAAARSEDWRDTLNEYLLSIPSDTYRAFFEECKQQHAIVLRFFIPTLCINGDLNRVSMDTTGAITGIEPTEYVVTGERLPQWPANDIFLEPDPHLPLIVTNPAGIGHALEMAYAYVARVIDAFVRPGTEGS
jgi:hypothetical protein